MDVFKITGILLILVPLGFNLIFFALQRRFEYPDILRKPTPYILEKFVQGGRNLIALWYTFAALSLAFVPIAVLVYAVLARDDAPYMGIATVFGILSGVFQALGLLRWSFLVPHLADLYSAKGASAATRDGVIVTFRAFHEFLGVAVGEHLGYLCTGLWTILIALAISTSPLFPSLIGWIGIVLALAILAGMLEPVGVKLAGAVVAIGYLLWSIWLIVVGILLLLH